MAKRFNSFFSSKCGAFIDSKKRARGRLYGTIWKLDSDFSIIWFYDTGNYRCQDLDLDDDGRIYGGASRSGLPGLDRDPLRTLWCLNNDGGLLWDKDTYTDYGNMYSMCARPAGGCVIHCLNQVVAFDSDGSVDWEYTVNVGTYGTGLANTKDICTDSSGNIYVARFKGVIKLNESGSYQWDSAPVGSCYCCYHDGGYVYVCGLPIVGNDYSLARIADTNGVADWQVLHNFNHGGTGPRSIRNGTSGIAITHFVGGSPAWNVGMYSSSNGSEIWTHSVANEGYMYCSDESSNIYCGGDADDFGPLATKNIWILDASDGSEIETHLIPNKLRVTGLKIGDGGAIYCCGDTEEYYG